MIGKQSVHRPTAIATLIAASPYGQAIPVIMGMTRAPLLPIWVNNLRKGSSNKKQKKKGISTYVENVDFLVGHNPILVANQFWNNNNVKAPLNLQKNITTTTGLPASVTISDPFFYSVIGVTVTQNYSFTFNDYGSQGSQTLSGSYETPMWNELLIGPGPTTPRTPIDYPFVYVWTPGSNVVSFPTGGTLGDGVPGGITAVNVYYYQLSAAISHETPLAVLRLTFEPALGNGPEYTGFAAQQIEYPQYAGCGSPNIDMGAAAAIPQLKGEFLGAHARYSTGDCDFADMIQYTIESGPVQAAIGTPGPNVLTQIGMGMYEMPGMVQHYTLGYATSVGNPNGITYRLQNQVGNLLLFFGTWSVAGTPAGVTDTAGNTWHVIDQGSFSTVAGAISFIFAYSFCTVSAANNKVLPNLGGNYGSSNWLEIAEVFGVDTFDTSAAATISGAGSWSSVAITTGNTKGNPDFIFAAAGGGSSPTGNDPHWTQASKGYFGISFFQTVFAPTTVELNLNGSASSRVALASFKATVPRAYPKPYGRLLDYPSLELCRTQCRANGLWGSISMDSQRKANEWLKDFYYSMNSEPGFTGHHLFSFPRSEASFAGNGAQYTSPTSSGPVANLSDIHGDFVGNPPITVQHKAQFSLPDILQIQHYNRASDYQQVSTSEPESASLFVLGVKKGSPMVHNEIQDPTIARMLIAIEGRRNQYILPWTYKFTLQPRWDLLSLYDLVTISDASAGINLLPVRLTKVVYKQDGTVDCEAEKFLYGMHAPNVLPGQPATPNVPGVGADPGLVNAPIIFEAVPRLFQSAQPQLWIVVSGSNVNYGGCIVYLSTDAGNSYNAIGQVNSNGIQGVTTADWPINADPDTTNDLPVDLTQSNGLLSSYQAADRDNFTYPCYIGGGTASIPYGLMTYNTANQTATSKYTLKATGAGNELRRCVFNTPQASPDVDHPNGSSWAFLGNPAVPSAQPGVFRVNLDPKWIGVTLMFKFLPINTFGTQSAALISSLTAYSFTPTGIPGGGIGQNLHYVNTPGLALSQTSTTNLSMVQVSTQFSSNTVTYNARSTITISTITTPTWLYVYIVDPTYVGDTGTGTNLAVQVDTTQVHLGVPGYTFMGAIQAVPSGFAGATVLPGGYPPPQVNIIGS